MSSYRNFNKDVIERSMKNLRAYNGDYEVTMLLNTLYMTLINPIEFNSKVKKDKKLKMNIDILVEYLNRHSILTQFENSFTNEKIITLLRNGLAHLNLEIIDDNEKALVEKVKISARNYTIKSKCPKCNHQFKDGVQYKEQEGCIIVFEFDCEQLKEFTFLVIDSILGDNICQNFQQEQGVKQCQN